MKKIKLDENLSKDEIEKLYQETIDWCEENTPLKDAKEIIIVEKKCS